MDAKHIKQALALSGGYSLFGALGLACLGNLAAIFGFDCMDEYPYLLGFSLVAGGIALIACLVLLAVNIELLRSQKKIKTIGKAVILEVFTTLVLFVPLLFLWIHLIEWAGGLF